MKIPRRIDVQLAGCGCFISTVDGPNPNDCAILIDAMEVIPQASGPTFLVHPSGIETVSFQTCGASFINMDASSAHEFCWDDFVRSIAVLMVSMITDQNCHRRVLSIPLLNALKRLQA